MLVRHARPGPEELPVTGHKLLIVECIYWKYKTTITTLNNSSVTDMLCADQVRLVKDEVLG